MTKYKRAFWEVGNAVYLIRHGWLLQECLQFLIIHLAIYLWFAYIFMYIFFQLKCFKMILYNYKQ